MSDEIINKDQTENNEHENNKIENIEIDNCDTSNGLPVLEAPISDKQKPDAPINADAAELQPDEPEPDVEKVVLDEPEPDVVINNETTNSDIELKNEPESDTSKPIEHILRVSSLYKRFGKKEVVRGVDFSMKTGEILGLLGPNGAGKTTTFYMIVGFYRPSEGEVFLDDKCITKQPMYRRARLGISYLPQEASVFRKLTVEENIWAVLETRHDLSRKERKQRLEQLIEEFAIGRIRKQQAFTLSGGERRRTEIARSLAIEPKFLLLDEPFAGIDPIAVSDIKSMVHLLANRGIGVLITDHNVRDTLEITDRAIIISTGQIVAQGGQKEILESPIARKIYLGEEFRM